MPYKYDVFISYSSLDRPWAQKLHDTLEAKGIKPFFDKDRLDIGKPWERQLSEAIKNAQHLVVFWSNNAKQSDWVQREMALFDTIQAESQVSQRLILINLEGQNTAYTAWQVLDDLKAAHAYTKGIEALDANLWQDMTQKVEQAIRSDDTSIPIPVVILTLTQGDLSGLDQSAWNMLTDLGIKQASLAHSYGAQRADWHPFGSPDGIRHILDRLLDQINLAVTAKNLHFRWELAGEDFWSNNDAARRYAASLLSMPVSLIVIDPIALHNQLVYRRLVTLQKCFTSKKSAIFVLPPFSMSTASRHLRHLVQNWGQPVFDPYYNPPIPPENEFSAHCGMTVGDEEDVKRLLFSTLGDYVLATQPPGKPAALRLE